jgi:hypothetical protein
MELGTLVGFVFTLLIFSYLLGDNILYRLAINVFVGVAAAYTIIIIVQGVLLPLLDSTGELILFIVALILTGLLLAKPIRGLTSITNLSLAFLIAVGTAVAVAGAITGTLIPLTQATGTATDAQGLVNGVLIVVGVVTSLLYFQYSARTNALGEAERGRLNRIIATVGQGFIAVTLGALYGTAILTSLTLLTERMSFITSILQ